MKAVTSRRQVCGKSLISAAEKILSRREETENRKRKAAFFGVKKQRDIIFS